MLPETGRMEALIEWTHRLTSGLSVLLISLLVLGAFRLYPSRHRVRVASVVALGFIFSEALIGAGLVLFRLVAYDASLARALFISAHLTNTFLLIGSLSLVALWSRGGLTIQLKGRRVESLLLIIALAGTLVLAISGALAALGDTLFPTDSFWNGLSQDFSPTTHILLRLRLLHPVIAICVTFYLLVVVRFIRIASRGGREIQLSFVLLVILVVQVLAGFLNVLLRAPIWLQLLHLLLANLMWISLVLLSASILSTENQLPEGRSWFANRMQLRAREAL